MIHLILHEVIELKKIMIIEDSKLHQEKIKDIISDLDYEVSGVFDQGKKAIDYILKENYHPDLIITDIILEGKMDGYQTAKKIRAETNIPFIFLTSKKEEVEELEASVYLNKPINKIELKNNIKFVLYKHKIFKKMKKNNEEKEMILDTIDTQIWYLKDPKTYGKVNQAHADFIGLDKSDIEDKKLTNFLDEEEAKICNLGNTKVFREKKKIQSEEWLENSNGEKRLISITKNPKLNKDGEVEYVVCSGEDITEQRKKEKIIKEKNDFLSTILEVQNSLFLLLDSDGKIVGFNKACEKLTGYTEEEVKDKKVWDLFIKQNEKKEVEKVFNQLKNKDYPNKHENHWLTKTGEEKIISWSNNVILDDENNIKYIVATGIDITERKMREKQIEYLSFHDELTGLYNRRFFEEEMKRLDTKRQLPISIIMADLNGLKIINDSYGHEKGDELLKRTASILKDSIRDEDILARQGGDEFAVLLPKTQKEKAKKVLSRIKNETKKTSAENIPVSIALGVATKENIEQDIEKIFKKADDNMYQNKLSESKSSKSNIVKGLLNTLSAKSSETKAHTQRLKNLSKKFGKKLRLSNSELNKLSLLATLHDIGKTSISEEILNKTDDLTKEEWEIMKEHSETGYKIALASNEFVLVAEKILSHHENWDGSGYPRGLAGEEIPYLSRIISIIDAYDVMTHERPYSKAISNEEALAEIDRFAGTQFDPDLAKEFIELKSNR